MVDLLAVVVSYGETTQLNHLMHDLIQIPRCRVVLVENKTDARHEALPPGVEVLGGHGNVGYGTAVNLAVTQAVQGAPTPDWLLVVNSDIALPVDTRKAIPPLLGRAFGQSEAVGFAVRTSGGHRGRSAAVLPSVRTNAFTAVRGENAAVARWPHHRYPVGAFFAIRTETFVRLGGFDPAYWMYYEETDLFARLRATGGRIAWVDEALYVVHEGGGTTGRAGLLHVELGRAAAIYARSHRHSLGATWPLVHAAQLTALAARKAVTGRTEDAARAARILGGLARGLANPAWEPAATSSWRATPAADRVRMGSVPTGNELGRSRAPAGSPTELRSPTEAGSPIEARSAADDECAADAGPAADAKAATGPESPAAGSAAAASTATGSTAAGSTVGGPRGAEPASADLPVGAAP